mmetsp:Transcript_7727/g.15950  ORF Transcript_7727/g.15950 Transcript_7727/m.15950 type:complete len:361 (+) Transcript_7727:1112-2194(+)
MRQALPTRTSMPGTLVMSLFGTIRKPSTIPCPTTTMAPPVVSCTGPKAAWLFQRARMKNCSLRSPNFNEFRVFLMLRVIPTSSSFAVVGSNSLLPLNGNSNFGLTRLHLQALILPLLQKVSCCTVVSSQSPLSRQGGQIDSIILDNCGFILATDWIKVRCVVLTIIIVASSGHRRPRMAEIIVNAERIFHLTPLCHTQCHTQFGGRYNRCGKVSVIFQQGVFWTSHQDETINLSKIRQLGRIDLSHGKNVGRSIVILDHALNFQHGRLCVSFGQIRHQDAIDGCQFGFLYHVEASIELLLKARGQFRTQLLLGLTPNPVIFGWNFGRQKAKDDVHVLKTCLLANVQKRKRPLFVEINWQF